MTGWYKRKLREGRCTNCPGKARRGKIRCASCARAESRRGGEPTGKRKAYACSRCLREGHNKATCTERRG